ncbi:MAG: thymidylate synthase [Candidatus Woesearchaeota archaeon]
MIRGLNTFQTWRAVLDYCNKHARIYKDRKNRVCIESLHVSFELLDFEDITRPITVLSHVEKWMYPSPEQIRQAILFPSINARTAYSYGHRLFDYEGFNQIDQKIIPLLQKDPNTRQAVASLILGKKETTQPSMELDIPAIVSIDFKIRDDTLVVCFFLRSSDILIGLPANMYQAYVLGQYVQKQVQTSKIAVVFHLASAHYFEDCQDIYQKVMRS